MMAVAATYTRDEIASAMRGAGFPDPEVRTGIGIVLAESLGRAEATNDTPGREYSVGPWQINLLAHPDVSESCARDLVCSTQVAFRLWRDQGWGPWGAFTSGSYRRFVEGPAQAAAEAAGAVPVAVQRGVADFLADRLGITRDSIVSAALSVSATALALVLIVFGIITLARGAIAQGKKSVG